MPPISLPITLQVYLRTHRLLGAGFFVEQMVVVAVYLLRRPAREVTRRARDWVLAFGGTFTPVLLRPDGAHPQLGVELGTAYQVFGRRSAYGHSLPWDDPLALLAPTVGSYDVDPTPSSDIRFTKADPGPWLRRCPSSPDLHTNQKAFTAVPSRFVKVPSPTPFRAGW